MEKIIFTEEILFYFDELINTLFVEEYFGYVENAQLYVTKIVDFIIVEIHNSPHKRTPEILGYLGSNYIFYKFNKRTTWYIFFEKKDTNILITGIFNTHCEEAKSL
ncbi:hypothetical protein [Flavobacterium sp.]|uniref:hypothetical protein n=1 Tax=Flavobacterium sp. TaxID=239 RepID=UPI003C465D06